MSKFNYVQPTDEEKALMQIYRDKFQALYDEMNSHGITNRGMSIANTKLEESSMWLNRAITNNC